MSKPHASTPSHKPQQPAPRDLATSVRFLTGVGPARAEALAELGLTNIARLVTHLPFRYEWERAESPVNQLQPGVMSSARGQITATRLAGRGGRQRFEAVLMDESGRLDLVWFNQPYLKDTIVPGLRLWVQGKPVRRGGSLQMSHPFFEVLPDNEPDRRLERLRPVYPATARISSRQIQHLIEDVLPDAVAQIDDHFDEAYRRTRELPTLADAYRMMHAPASEQELADARRRLAYDELFMLQLAVHLKRAHLREHLRAPPLPSSPAVERRIRDRLPFTLTSAQQRVVREISDDLSRPTPANRLIQGDVGSGKTAVAAWAMLLAVANGHQAALMAPTEILAEQHYDAFTRLLENSRVRIALLTGALSAHEHEQLLSHLTAGEIDLLIGTHALLTERVEFASLALAVIDEQHRFGVHQRAALRAKGADEHSSPHTLVMTATPIPRTVAMTLFGDLDVSIIDELPPGRSRIATRVLPPERRDEAYAFLRDRLARGDQAYVVVPTIDSDQSSGVEAVLERLRTGALAGHRVEPMHARLPRRQREQTMADFRDGHIHCLVCTTVIEVGVDVPNATVMLIEEADRFGLAQLHQLRGRVGRGPRASACVLIADPKTPDAVERLEAMRTIADGFELAERDFQIRGPGELIGARQSGDMLLEVADLSRDLDLLKLSRADAAAWVNLSPRLDRPADALLRRRLVKKYGDALGLADVG
ncbi:MAG: ATP-dependent DNA helicase RecG [Phycisphaerales bacterium]|nr:ATP-dependent DNA helicase RecG [Phycisphaerales bacterium]